MLFQDANNVIWMQFLPFYGRFWTLCGHFRTICQFETILRPFIWNLMVILVQFLVISGHFGCKKKCMEGLAFLQLCLKSVCKIERLVQALDSNPQQGGMGGLAVCHLHIWPPERKSSNFLPPLREIWPVFWNLLSKFKKKRPVILSDYFSTASQPLTPAASLLIADESFLKLGTSDAQNF